MTVQDDARLQQASTILERNGASLGSRLTGQTNGAPSVDSATEDTRNMKLRAERLQASTTSTQVGEVGLHKEVVSEQQNIDVPCRTRKSTSSAAQAMARFLILGVYTQEVAHSYNGTSNRNRHFSNRKDSSIPCASNRRHGMCYTWKGRKNLFRKSKRNDH